MDMLNGVRSLLETGATDSLKFPTEAHRAFIDFITQQCRERSITALLKGSLVKGTAKKNSDIDIILMGKNIFGCFDTVIGAFDEILLSEHFTATSTCMVVYMNGLAVEYDLRRSVTAEDIRKACVLNVGDYLLSDIRRDRIFVDSRLCPTRNSDYSKLMIAQMCCAKLLCQKAVLARDIYYDRMNLLIDGQEFGDVLDLSAIHAEPQNQFLNRIRQLVYTSNACSTEIKEYLNYLLSNIQDESKGLTNA